MEVLNYLKEIDKNLKQEKNEIWVKVKKEKLKRVLEKLRNLGVSRISSISGVDVGKKIEIIYHFIYNENIINIRTSVPKENPEISTIIEIYPGANLFERELAEMLGVKVLGHPNPKRLFLPEDWKGKPPLRKD